MNDSTKNPITASTEPAEPPSKPGQPPVRIVGPGRRSRAGTLMELFGFLWKRGRFILIPLLVLLGFYFGESIVWLSAVINRIDFLLTVSAAVACIVVLGYYLWKRRRPPARK